MIRIPGISLPLDYDPMQLHSAAARALHIPIARVQTAQIVRRSVDARDKGDVHFVVTLDAAIQGTLSRLPNGAEYLIPSSASRPTPPAPAAHTPAPIVVGLGPAGLFAALTLARAGRAPIVIERGQPVDRRTRDVEALFSNGVLDPNSNTLFGEGGAGAFSDGKLNTGIKSPHARGILETLVQFGAPEAILIDAKPHVGTDRLKGVVRGIREEIVRLGGTVHFGHTVTQLHIEDGRLQAIDVRQPDGVIVTWPARQVLLAVGHSARDTFEMLNACGIAMERKPFSIGARIEHPQRMIDRCQYGAFADHPALGAADYKLNVHLPNGRGAYTFCMCPGGQVICAASEPGAMNVNGMSEHARAGENANAALLVDVHTDDFPDTDGVLAGVAFQRKWEQRAFAVADGEFRAPAQTVEDFLRRRPSRGPRDVQPTYQPGVTWTALDECLPDFASESLRMALTALDRKLSGYAAPGAVLTGVETRSSSPVRVLRDAQGVSLHCKGLYPSGEGAGYAGGILSAAVDGVRGAHWIMDTENAD